MRLAIPMAESLFSAFITIFMKKQFDETLNKTAKDRLQEVEDFLAKHGNLSVSAFALGTADPTQLDLHLYVSLARIEFYRGSCFHDELFVPLGFDSYTRCKALIEAI
jgi:hypothetical protein